MQRKWLVAGGIVVLFLISVAAAFSVGVYIGRYGLTRDGLALRGPKAGQGNAASALQPADLPGKPQAVGRIRRIHPDGLGLATIDGPRLVLVDGETKYQDQDGESIAKDALQVGQIVAIFGIPDGRQEMMADLVIVVGEDAVKTEQRTEK